MSLRDDHKTVSARLEEVRTELRTLADAETYDEERGSELLAELDTLEPREAELAAALERVSKFEAPMKRSEPTEQDREAVKPENRIETPVAASFNVNTRQDDDPFDLNEIRIGAAPSELRGRVHQALERGMTGVNDHVRERIARTMESADNARGDVSRHILATGSDAYRRAWGKLVSGRQYALDRDEADALEFGRAASLTDSAGGYALPTVIDPTIVLSGDGTSNPFRMISRVVQTASDNYNVNSSAGVSASFDAEATESSDDAPTLAQTTITPAKAQATVPFSIEIGQDWVGMEMEMGRLFVDAKDVLEGSAFATGSGTNAPVGIVTALDANTNVELSMTTGGAFGIVDVYAAIESVGPRFRQNASWLMNYANVNRIRQFATANNYHGFTVDLTAEGIPLILGKPVYESSTMASAAFLTTTTTNEIVVGDFSNFVIVDRVGMSVELIPHLFATANNLPSGQRALYCHWRVGSDSVNDTAFTLLQNGVT